MIMASPLNDNKIISAGSPEAPIEIGGSGSNRSETNPQEEFGYEQLQKIDREAAELMAAERKDKKLVEDPNNSQNNLQVKQATKEKKKVDGPKYFGYSIPAAIAGNYKQIAKNKGKGDPNSSQTWVYVLLDKLLKVKMMEK